jgi:anti-sigma B factor antagonist
MPLTLHSRRIGDITVVTCSGRIIEGSESASLRQHLEGLAQDPCVVLNLGAIDFVDSTGLGMLVRLLTRSRTVGGDLKLCDVSSRIREVLRITRLDTLFDILDSEAEAIQPFYQRGTSTSTSRDLKTDILCIGRSADVQAYVRELLGKAGYGVLTVTTLSDAITLLKATRPKLAIIATERSNAGDTRTVDALKRINPTLATIELPADFSGHDAGTAGERLLDDVRATLRDR